MASELASRIADRSQERPGAGQRHRGPTTGLRLSFPCAGADLYAARACEQRVFGRRYGNTPDELEAEYDRYRTTTSFGAVFLPDGSAAGAVRLVRAGEPGLKTLQDSSRPPWSLAVASSCRQAGLDPEATWDVATFGVDGVPVPSTWRRSVTLALFSVMFGAFRDNGVAFFVAILDQAARGPIDAHGVTTTDLPGARPAPYLGSPASVPVYAVIADLHRRHAVDHAGIHPQVFHGRLIDGVDPAEAGPGRFALPIGTPQNAGAPR